jgi:phage-related protein
MRVKFYLTSSGKSPVEEFLANLSDELKGEFFDAVAKLVSGETLTMPLNRNLSSIRPGLHELRFKDRAGQVRFFYFVKKSDAIYMVHAIRKKTQQIQKKDVDLILKRLREI